MNLHKDLTAYLNKEHIIIRPLQIEALDKTLIAKQGQVFLPTGVGKTLVEVITSLDMLLRKQDKNKTGVAAFAAHRLILCDQLLGQLIRFAHGLELSFDVLTVASEGVDEEDVAFLREGLGDLLRHCTVKKTTTMEEVADFVEETGKRNRHLLMVSTYQSFARLQNIPKNGIDIACMDEAHTLVAKEIQENLKIVLDKNIIRKEFYFTATPVYGCNGRGMNNPKVFGPVLLSKTPREAIDQGDILLPLIHKMTIKTTDDKKPSDAAIIKGAYLNHRKRIQKISGKAGKDTVAQLLVSVTGIDTMITLVKEASFQEWALSYGVETVAFSSAKGYFINGYETNRKEALKTIRELSKNNKPFILFHYDILTEGIDLPNLTGVLPLRELNRVKFLQTCGRAARITKHDRELLYKDGTKSIINVNGKVVLNSFMEKPCYWVIDTQINKDSSTEIIEYIRKEYDLEPDFREYVDPLPPTSVPKEVDDPYPPEGGFNFKENEAKTILQHKFEMYKLMALAQKKPGIDEILKLLNEDLDKLLKPLNGGSDADTKSKKPGNNKIDTSLPQTDRVGTQAGYTNNSNLGRGSLTESLGW